MNSPRSFRTTELAKEFARQGHQVTVLTPRNPSYHDEFEQEHNLVIKDLGARSWKELSIEGTGLRRLLRRGIKRLLNLLLLYPEIELMYLLARALKKERGHDLLISIAAPHVIHWGVARVWKHPGVIADIWIADCGDPFMGAENDSFKKPFYFKYVEKWWCRKVDFITIPIEEARLAYYPEFRDKITVIPQGFKMSDYKIKEGEPQNKVATFAYAGIFIPQKRDPSEFLNYLTKQSTPFEFYIYTRTPDLIRPYLEKAKGQIILSDYIPRYDLLEKLSTMDFLVNFENAGPLQRPSKLIDYLIAGRPVLSVKYKDFKPLIVKEFLNCNYTNQLVLPSIDNYRIENIIANFLALSNQANRAEKSSPIE